MRLLSLPESLGSFCLKRINSQGRAVTLLFLALVRIFMPPVRWKLYFKQLEFIGNHSLTVVLLTGCFTGMVLALQLYGILNNFGAETVIGGVIGLSMVKELGPVLTALMVNARAGSAIAAEIGTMRVTEQISALDAMAVDSIQYLFSTRIFAGFIMLPLLTVISNFVGLLGGYIISVELLGADAGLYISKAVGLVSLPDIVGGLIKAAVFGLILTFVGCYQGYIARGGAEGVGQATTNAVVVSAVLILASDYLITSFLFLI